PHSPCRTQSLRGDRRYRFLRTPRQQRCRHCPAHTKASSPAVTLQSSSTARARGPRIQEPEPSPRPTPCHRASVAHVPEKRTPVFRKGHTQIKNLAAASLKRSRRKRRPKILSVSVDLRSFYAYRLAWLEMSAFYGEKPMQHLVNWIEIPATDIG